MVEVVGRIFVCRVSVICDCATPILTSAMA